MVVLQATQTSVRLTRARTEPRVLTAFSRTDVTALVAFKAPYAMKVSLFTIYRVSLYFIVNNLYDISRLKLAVETTEF